MSREKIQFKRPFPMNNYNLKFFVVEEEYKRKFTMINH